MQSVLSSCREKGNNNNEPTFSGKVIIIGAGAGGLSAGYLLQQHGIAFEIVEASAVYGGRMRINTEFANFPIPLGAEWLHINPNIFRDIVNNNETQLTINTVNYNSAIDTYAHWENGNLSIWPLEDTDIKFVNYSWFNFYEDYIVPEIANKIRYDTVVQAIDYTGDQVVINTQNGAYLADKVIIAVPLKILQDGDIIFTPTLPQVKAAAIQEITIWEGFKAFIEFSEKFYDTQIGFTINPTSDGQKLYYDAAYGQNTNQHILGLFAVGKPALNYTSLADEALIDYILAELDAIYNNQATSNYIKHTVQNWNNEPFIKAGYISDEANWQTVRKLSASVAGKIYFAGGAYTNGNDWVSVHTAAQSAKEAVQELVA